MAKKRKYDVVLFGATGFTGQLTAEYFAKAMNREDFSWAIAGRNELKLGRLKKRLESVNPKCRDKLEIVLAETGNPDSLAQMAADAKVVVTTVGPYILL